MARFRDIELEELPLEDIQGLGGELSPEMAALVERVGRSAEDVASRSGSRGVDVETLPVQDVSGVHADGRPFEGLPADDVEQADSGVRVSGERVEDPDEQVKRLVLKSIGDRQGRGDPAAEALRLATVEGQGRRRSAIEQARQDIAGADIGSDAWVAHLQRRAPNSHRRD